MSRDKGQFTEKTRRTIRERFNGACYYCGLRVEGGGQIHHRLPRRMGGTSDLIVSDVSNGVWLHQRCHDRIESKRTTAVRNGWVLRSGSDPRRVPLTTGWMGEVWLGDEPSPPVTPDG